MAAGWFGHGNDASHGKRLVQEAQSASLNQNPRDSHTASCSFLRTKTNPLQTEQPQDTPRPLELLSAEAGDTKRHLERGFLGFFPMFPALGHGEELQCVRVLLPARLENSGDAEEPEVGDHHLPVVIEDILGLEVLVEDALGMQVSHSLGRDRGRKTPQSYKSGTNGRDNAGAGPFPWDAGSIHEPPWHSQAGPRPQRALQEGKVSGGVPGLGWAPGEEMGLWRGCPSCHGARSSS